MEKEKKNLPYARKASSASSRVDPQAHLRDILAAGNEKALKDVLITMNVALSRGALEEEIRTIKETIDSLLELNQPATAKALGDLLEEMSLHYGDPLVEAAFEAGGQAPALLSLLGDVVLREKQLLQLRIRATEALFTRSAGAQSGRWIHSEAEAAVRALNQVLMGLEPGSLRGIKSAYPGMIENLKTIDRLLVKTEGLNRKPSAQEAHREILHLLETALRKLEASPEGVESVRAVLGILRANTPLPLWHPGIAEAPTGDPGLKGEERTDDEIPLALITDKAIEVVLSLASAVWAGEAQVPRRAGDPSALFSPSDPGMLESSVGNPEYPLKLRRMAAALLKVHGGSSAWSRLSPRAQFFSDLLLLPYRSDAVPYLLETQEEVSVVDVQEKIPFLSEALEEKSEYVRWIASRAGLRAAQDHPEWFRPRHYAKLLPLLTDDHQGVRLRIVQIFKALAALKEQRISSVIQGITDSLTEKFYASEDTPGVRHDLEVALGATLGTLMENVEELQGAVRDLDERRRQLLGYIEEQTMRVGEEIHHEILNTLCGYLATAIDEENLGEARKWLEELVADLRRIMNRLYPRDLETRGFLSTIRKRLEDAGTQARKRIPEFRVEFDCPAEIRDSDIFQVLADPSHIVFLYRIILEAIINGRKHSGGDCLGIRVARTESGIFEISIYDNGRGNGGPFEQNVGIPLMLRRAQEIGAEIAFRKASDAGGTAVVIRLGAHPLLSR